MAAMKRYSVRERAGALLLDAPRMLRSLHAWAPGRRGSWIDMRNRDERLTPGDDGRGMQCDWLWTSELHLANVFPVTGRLLMQRALRDWPIRLADRPDATGPRITFVIPHKGTSRLPNLLLTLRSLAGQRGADVECIVVEQSATAEIAAALPAWVRHIHTPPPDDEMPFNKSWALNVGVNAAHSELVVLHDNDMAAPEAYAAEVHGRVAAGHEVIDLKRFIFYLDADATRASFASQSLHLGTPPETVVQNLTGGGTLAITREAYEAIGGYDETFYGWGGHDNDFWERALTRRVYPWGYLPFVHLWHDWNPGKQRQQDDPGVRRYAQLVSRTVAERIAALHGRPMADPRGPMPPWQEALALVRD